jgi:REP element-mobilizing transposase RayT
VTIPSDPPDAPRGWHNRTYLPHNDAGDLLQCITYRLADSLPSKVLDYLVSDKERLEQDAKFRLKIDNYLDAGYGECLLKDPRAAQVIVDSWNYFDGNRYDLLAWVVMPNHVHILIRARSITLSKIIHTWKSYTAHRINELVNLSGQIWHPDYWDRFIRDERHYEAVIEYIKLNPVRAGLVEDWQDWPWIGGAVIESSR